MGDVQPDFITFLLAFMCFGQNFRGELSWIVIDPNCWPFAGVRPTRLKFKLHYVMFMKRKVFATTSFRSCSLPIWGTERKVKIAGKLN